MPKMTRDYLGQKYVLWATTYSSAATLDGAGRIHDGYVVLDEYVAVVTKQVLTADTHHSSLELVARAESGEEFRFDGSSWRNKEERTPYVDIVDALKMSDEAHRYGSSTHVDEQGRPKVPVGTTFCLFHGCYYLAEDGCHGCWRDRDIWTHVHGEGPLHYVQCPFCEQLRAGWDQEDQHFHLSWAHKPELEARGTVRMGQHKMRFAQFSLEDASTAA
jgi:hypothetical protein